MSGGGRGRGSTRGHGDPGPLGCSGAEVRRRRCAAERAALGTGAFWNLELGILVEIRDAVVGSRPTTAQSSRACPVAFPKHHPTVGNRTARGRDTPSSRRARPQPQYQLVTPVRFQWPIRTLGRVPTRSSTCPVALQNALHRHKSLETRLTHSRTPNVELSIAQARAPPAASSSRAVRVRLSLSLSFPSSSLKPLSRRRPTKERARERDARAYVFLSSARYLCSKLCETLRWVRPGRARLCSRARWRRRRRFPSSTALAPTSSRCTSGARAAYSSTEAIEEYTVGCLRACRRMYEALERVCVCRAFYGKANGDRNRDRFVNSRS